MNNLKYPGIIHDLPSSEGIYNAIKRAEQFLNIYWKPIKPMPMTVRDKNGICINKMFDANKPIKGLPYSSVRLKEKYIGFNISLETFMTALQNPYSVLYTQDLHDSLTDNAGPYFGTACSAFVSYALNLPYRLPTTLLPGVGMERVECRNIDDTRLCDVLISGTHVAMVIDVTRNNNGKVHTVSVAEATMPICICTEFLAEEYEKVWYQSKNCTIYRYNKLNDIEYEPGSYEQINNECPGEDIYNKTLGLNYGNKSNYNIGENIEYCILEEGYRNLLIHRDGMLQETIELSGQSYQRIKRSYNICGLYEACCKDAKGNISDSVFFKVVHAAVCTEKSSYYSNEELHVRFASPSNNDIPLCITWSNEKFNTKKVIEIPNDTRCKNSIVTSYPVPGKYLIKVFYKNSFGIYCSEPIDILIE